MAHTPGPWVADKRPTEKRQKWYVRSIRGTQPSEHNPAVAAIINGAVPWQEMEDNAHLIGAAPEMLVELREAWRVLEDVHDIHIYSRDDRHPADCYYCAQTERLRLLILKAQGKES